MIERPELKFQPPEVQLPGGVNIHIIFGPHETKADWTNRTAIQRRLKWKTDIFIPESIEMDSETLDIFNAVSRGDQSAYHMAANSIRAYKAQGGPAAGFFQGMIDVIKGTNVIIGNVDLEVGDPTAADKKRIVETRLSDLMMIDFDRTLEKFDQLVEREAEIDNIREAYMLERLSQFLDEIIQRNPRLRNQRSINVVMTLGGLHTPIFQALRRITNPAESKITREFSEKPFVYRYFDRLYRSYRFGVDVDPETRLLWSARRFATVAVEQNFGDQIERFSNKTLDRMKLVLEVVGRLSIGDIREIHGSYTYIRADLSTEVWARVARYLEESVQRLKRKGAKKKKSS